MRFGISAIARRAGAFIRDTRAGATAIAAAAVTVMTVGASALIVDHVWLIDQRDVLKTAADAGAVAATLEIDRQLAKNPRISDDDLKAALHPVAARYVFENLMHLPIERLLRARDTLVVEITELDRDQRTVGVTAKADLGGTLFSRALPLLGSYEGPGTTFARAGVESESTPVEVVLAIDVSNSMKGALDGGPAGRAGKRSRMETVRSAAERLVDILEPNARDRVAVGIVPWDIIVRLDAQSAGKWAGKDWARYPDENTYPYPWNCGSGCAVEPVVDALPSAPPSEWRGCLEEQRVGASGTASLSGATAAALFATPAQSPFAQHFFPPWPKRAYRSRDASEWPTGAFFLDYLAYDTRPQLAQVGCPAAGHPELVALSTDRAAVESAIGALQPVGMRTYSSLGILWAQRMLEPAWKGVWGGAVHPADPATPGHAGLRKAIVLLTDGQDSYCLNVGVDCAANGLMISRADACTQAKARGTEIFVVAAMHPDAISGALGNGLSACSSENDLDYPQGTRRPGATYVFLNNATSESLEAAFADIARQLRTLRKVS